MNDWTWTIALFLAFLVFILAKLGWNLRHAEIDRRMRWLLPLPLFFVPVAALWGFNERATQGSKTIQFCGSCHAMSAHVNDIYDTASKIKGTVPI